MSSGTATTVPSVCPQCGAGMKTRRGPRGDFLGCTRYPECRGTRPIEGTTSQSARQASARSAAAPPSEEPGPTDTLIADLRAAAGHIGRAVDLLRRHQAELDQLVADRDGGTF